MPHLPVKIAEIRDLRSANARENVAAPQSRRRRWTTVGQGRNDDFSISLGGINPEPGPHRLVHTSISQEVIENRGQQVDRHDHVDVARSAMQGRLLDVERADAKEPTRSIDGPSSAPKGMRWGGKDSLL